MKAELSSLQKKVFEGLADQDSVTTDTNFKCERIDRMFHIMKEDVLRHETLSFELAKKFESQHEILLQFAENIEAIKSHALMTDLHLEAYLPVQMASLTYEICKSLVSKENAPKFQQNFAQKTIKSLEKNIVRIMDPMSGDESRRFPKIDYKLPKEIAEMMCEKGKSGEEMSQKNNVKYKNILNKVNLSNVQVYTDRAQGNIPLLNESIANARKNNLAMTLVRRNDFNSKLIELTGEKTEIADELKHISLQDHFHDLTSRALKIIKRPIDTANMQPFHVNAMSKLAQLLDMNNVTFSAGRYLKTADQES